MPMKTGTALRLAATVAAGIFAAAAPSRADDDLRLLLNALSRDVRTLARSGARGWYDDDRPSFTPNIVPQRRSS